jgi:hypothetical protein
LKDWACAPDDLVWLAGRKQKGGLHVAQAVDASLGRGRRDRKRLVVGN